MSSARSDRTPVTGPVRTCIGCRQRAAKHELLRVTAGSDPDGHPAVVPDPTATAPGRGAHLHPTTECFDLAVRRKSFNRAFTRDLRAGHEGLSPAPVGDYLQAVAASRSST
ncbi:YlxR family protein [Nocardioides sp.]|uniref:YlxR family protein n=1 Tax=Nocardioides sp. TaxID=35761 RepID=UPI001A2DA976|nr:YlxR family protein [Nocardioides sp.]MBJ7358413.1 YlxR family protein [Nocardioides sp.]